MKDSDGSTNFELMEKAKQLRLNNFRGVFMRDQTEFQVITKRMRDSELKYK